MAATHQSVVINAPIEKIWQAVRDFHAMPFAAGVIEQVDKIGDIPGDQVGAKRILNGVFHETLREFSDAGHQLAYSIDDGPSPVSNADVSGYVGRLSLQQCNDGVLVEWSSSWEGNDQAAEEFCHAIYVALLDGLKAYCER